MRVALGVAAATLSLFLGEWISLRGQKIFARGLTGLGLALLYLSFYGRLQLLSPAASRRRLPINVPDNGRCGGTSSPL